MPLTTRALAAALVFIAGAPLAQAQTISPAVNASYFIVLAPRSDAAIASGCLQQTRSITPAVNGKVEVAIDKTSPPQSNGRCPRTETRPHE